MILSWAQIMGYMVLPNELLSKSFGSSSHSYFQWIISNPLSPELWCHIKWCSPAQCATLATTNQCSKTMYVGHPYQSYDIPPGDAHLHSSVCHSGYTTSRCTTHPHQLASLHWPWALVVKFSPWPLHLKLSLPLNQQPWWSRCGQESGEKCLWLPCGHPFPSSWQSPQHCSHHC